jgi:Mg-chelatase subunit ChlD
MKVRSELLTNFPLLCVCKIDSAKVVVVEFRVRDGHVVLKLTALLQQFVRRVVTLACGGHAATLSAIRHTRNLSALTLRAVKRS